ncbi:MAG TPA: bifunctional fucokinase/fucose-1-phosphate guanylyltransferase [Terracidiphilus sp.]|nr:bifunctional fucokinase/fucose-1-phosphate guanylyltransferase [Terracidiphilus sp.]
MTPTPGMFPGSAAGSWDAVIVTASSARQAELYREEIQRRSSSGMVPSSTEFLVVPDPENRRLGSGGATINALGVFGKDREWWNQHKVLLVHSGGDSRRLPQYSPVGKLFGVLPSRSLQGGTTTVFDETISLSSAWAENIPNGLLVGSGDVVLRFDASRVRWDRPGVTGLAMPLDVETAKHHGVYVIGAGEQVYTFLQKPTPAELKAAGGLLADGRAAVDIGLLRFDPQLTSALAELSQFKSLPQVDLYDHVTRGLTGQWKADGDAGLFWRELGRILRDSGSPAPFHCSIVAGEFIHVGTTRSFRSLAATSGGVLDSALVGPVKIGHGAVVLECDLNVPVCAGRGAILHGLTGLHEAVDVPEDVVVHQLPVQDAAGPGWVIRAYGVEDDPKHTFENATWFNRPILETLSPLGLRPDEVWKAGGPRTLWDAALFPVTTPDEAWACARWMMGYGGGYDSEKWRRARRLSLAESARSADGKSIAEARSRRLQNIWQGAAVELAQAGADLRPLLANPPGVAPAAAAGRALIAHADQIRNHGVKDLTQAASYLMQAARLLERAGASAEAERAENRAFACIQGSVAEGDGPLADPAPARWCFERVHVSAPARVDLGGGWSDTPPFCFDWGGTVLNCALEIDGEFPIETEVRRISEPVIRCRIDGQNAVAEYRTSAELLEPCAPGSVFSIPRAAIQLRGILSTGEPLDRILARLGGGLEIRCRVSLPIGSGLGTSSILAATVVRALAEIAGHAPDNHALSATVMRLEQRMTTGGGWQDQAGGIFPGAKLLITGPGLRQRIRVQPVAWNESRRSDFCRHLLLYNTGIQRMAKDLLRQVVSRYLARETATVQVLHSIKTLAVEMSYAMAEGDWMHLGELLDRHWQLNQVLDPHTTNAPINAILDLARPWIYGAKLAGAGGGGFLMLLARDPEAADILRTTLAREAPGSGGFTRYRIAEDGLRVQAMGIAQNQENEAQFIPHPGV